MTQVDVEVVRLAVDADGLGYGLERRALADDEVPDDAARELAPARTRVLHSTSWRHEGPGVVVLTYAAAPVPPDEGTQPLLEPSVVCSGDPLSPSPGGLHAHHVAAHAARHLAYLVDRDPGVAAAASDPAAAAFWRAVRATADIPTGTHQDAHRRAHQQTQALLHPATPADAARAPRPGP